MLLLQAIARLGSGSTESFGSQPRLASVFNPLAQAQPSTPSAASSTPPRAVAAVFGLIDSSAWEVWRVSSGR